MMYLKRRNCKPVVRLEECHAPLSEVLSFCLSLFLLCVFVCGAWVAHLHNQEVFFLKCFCSDCRRWQEKFGKVYASQDEEKYRRGIFEGNRKKVASMNTKARYDAHQ